MWTLRREAARVVLLDSRDRVLLLEASDPANRAKGSWWELPGGGIEPGEPSGAAAARELHEETGIDGVEMGPCVWRHHARFTFAGYRFDQEEHIHVARCPLVEPAVGEVDYAPAGLEAIEALAFKGIRWWAAGELTGLRVIPPWLPTELPAFLEAGPPAEPTYLGELGEVF